MPQVFAFIAPVFGAGGIFGAGGLFGFLGTGIGGALLKIGIGIGLQLLAQKFFGPDAPKPEDVQNNIKNAISPRIRHYGRVKTGGTLAFIDSKDGALHKVIATGHGRLDGIEEYWVDSTPVELDVNGLVTTEIGEQTDVVTIKSRLGLPTETSYSELTAVFPEWTANHRGDGVSSLYVVQHEVKASKFQSVFPNGWATTYRIVARAARLYDLRNPAHVIDDPATWEWSDNLALVLFDYLRHPDGMRLPASLLTTPQALLLWREAINDCAEPVPLKGGGTEPRYRASGSYSLDERPADVVRRIMAAGDAWFVSTPDGGLAVKVGKYEEPTAIIDESSIIGFEAFGRGRDILQTANTVRVTYTSADHDYQLTEAQAWTNDDDIAARGEIPAQVDLPFVPSHGQARRLAKVLAHDADPELVGTFTCNLKGLAAVGSRFVRINYPAFGVNHVFKIRDARYIVGEGSTLLGVQFDVFSATSAAYEWDPAAEEGDPPAADEVTVDRTVPTPSGFSVTVVRQTISGTVVPLADLAWTAGNDSLRIQAEYKLSAEGSWSRLNVPEDENKVRSGVLQDNSSYDFRIRFVTSTGRVGAWASTITVNVVADTTAPAVVSGVSATGGTGQTTLNWTTPNSANYAATNIRRNTTNNEGAATLVRTEYGPRSSADSYVDSGLAAGTYYYWLKAANASGTESASVATGAVTVT